MYLLVLIKLHTKNITVKRNGGNERTCIITDRERHDKLQMFRIDSFLEMETEILTNCGVESIVECQTKTCGT